MRLGGQQRVSPRDSTSDVLAREEAPGGCAQVRPDPKASGRGGYSGAPCDHVEGRAFLGRLTLWSTPQPERWGGVGWPGQGTGSIHTFEEVNMFKTCVRVLTIALASAFIAGIASNAIAETK